MRMGWLAILSLACSSVALGQNIPKVIITTPTLATTYTTSTSPLFVSGTAHDNHRVMQVSWTNDRGGSGTAQGTTSWSASIALQTGANRLTVRAFDASGHQGQDVLTVTLTAPPPPPGPITVEWTYGSTMGDAFQMERCVAPLPCPMAPIAAIPLADRSWIDSNVLSSQNYCYRMAVLTGESLGPYSNTLCSP